MEMQKNGKGSGSRNSLFYNDEEKLNGTRHVYCFLLLKPAPLCICEDLFMQLLPKTRNPPALPCPVNVFLRPRGILMDVKFNAGQYKRSIQSPEPHPSTCRLQATTAMQNELHILHSHFHCSASEPKKKAKKCSHLLVKNCYELLAEWPLGSWSAWNPVLSQGPLRGHGLPFHLWNVPGWQNGCQGWWLCCKGVGMKIKAVKYTHHSPLPFGWSVKKQ